MPKRQQPLSRSDSEDSTTESSRAQRSKTKANFKKSRKQSNIKSMVQKPKERSKQKLSQKSRTSKSKTNLPPTSPTHCAQMSESSIRKLQKLLEPTKLDQSELRLKKCVSIMTSTNQPHILFLSVLRKAIIHSLLERRWNDLVELLMMLVDNYYGWIFTHFVRQICEIICHLDPRVAGTELGDQLDLIRRVYTAKKENLNIV